MAVRYPLKYVKEEARWELMLSAWHDQQCALFQTIDFDILCFSHGSLRHKFYASSIS